MTSKKLIVKQNFWHIQFIPSNFLIYTFIIAYIIQGMGCKVLEPDSSKYNFSDGYYYTMLPADGKTKVYLSTSTDTIKVYPASVAKQIGDTTKMVTVLFPPTKRPSQFKGYSFVSRSFDIDVLTVLFKYRFASTNFPAELNGTFNGAVYAGYRTDNYKLFYKETPLKTQVRKIRHYGYSIGGIMGVGTARIDEYVTLNRLDYQYDGAVVFIGIAAILGFNKINFGITSGLDYLTDRNKDIWVHQGKPWMGISIGLNLN